MDWTDWLRILRWRALEEGDADGALLTEERRREATARTRAGLTSDAVVGDPVSAREMGFLQKRAEWLEREVVGCGGPLVRVMERLVTADGRWTWAITGWAAAMVAGYALSGLGQEAELNLLALPLVGVLLWNGIIMAAALVWELWPAAKVGRGSEFLEWLATRVAPTPHERMADSETLTGLTVDQRFARLASAPASERLQRRLRAWMHIAAALLALGSLAGLYARGWSREYRAVWESSILQSENSAQRFFGTLFAPAAVVLRLELPLTELEVMHRTGGRSMVAAPALPWIHLYAGTLLLLVIVPRAGLAGLTLLRARQVLEKRLRKLGWRSYLVRALRAVEGGGESVSVLIHATDAKPAHREVWTRGIHRHFGAMVQPEMIQVALGDEDDFVAAWRPETARVVVVFNLATTPEMEVQRRFVQDVRQALLARQREGEVVVLLDATSIGNRWSPEKHAGREKLWTEMMQGLADEVIIAAKKGVA